MDKMVEQIIKSHKVFKVIGTTQDVTECELCGRVDLKGTIVLDELDDEGNTTGSVVYYGAICGAKAAGWTTKEIRTQAKAADLERNRVYREAMTARTNAFCEARDTWCQSTYGTDIWHVPGVKFFDVVTQFEKTSECSAAIAVHPVPDYKLQIK